MISEGASVAESRFYSLVALQCGPAPKRYTGVTRRQLTRYAMSWRQQASRPIPSRSWTGSMPVRDVFRPRRLPERNRHAGDSKHDPGLGSSCLPRLLPDRPRVRLQLFAATPGPAHAHMQRQIDLGIGRFARMRWGQGAATSSLQPRSILRVSLSLAAPLACTAAARQAKRASIRRPTRQ